MAATRYGFEILTTFFPALLHTLQHEIRSFNYPTYVIRSLHVHNVGNFKQISN